MVEPDEVRSLREAFDATQTEFARILGVTRTAYVRWENGDSTPHKKRQRTIEDLADVIDEETGDLIGDAEGWTVDRFRKALLVLDVLDDRYSPADIATGPMWPKVEEVLEDLIEEYPL